MKRVSAVVLADEANGKSESQDGISEGPLRFQVHIEGIAPILFHRWDCAAVEAKSKAKKNSREKKSDNVESYVYRCEDGTLGYPATNIHSCLIHAAKSKADPRSPRKSASDLVKAILLVTPPMMSFGKKEWDFDHMARVVVQRNAITRIRPALKAEWALRFEVTILDSSYLDSIFLQDLVVSAGAYSGLGDWRPQFGRFSVSRFERLG